VRRDIQTPPGQVWRGIHHNCECRGNNSEYWRSTATERESARLPPDVLAATHVLGERMGNDRQPDKIRDDGAAF
jgi:hypothetical protein